MANIAIPSSRLDPGIFVKILFGAGPSNAGGGQRDACYVGAMAISGTTATAGTKYKIEGADHARELFGISPIWWALKSHFDCWKGGNVYAIAHAPTTADGSYALASATVTIGGTEATAAGFVTLKMFGEEEVIGYASGAVDDDIAAAVTGRINAKVAAGQWCLGTATTSTTVTTVNSPIPGLSQNGIYPISATVSPGTSITVTVSATTLGSGADGDTTELSRLSAVLAANLANDAYYIGITHKQGTTQNGYLKTHMTGRLAQNLQLRGRGFIAGRDAKSSLISAAVAQNYERMCLVGEPSSEYDPAWLVGQAIAWTQASEHLNPAANMTDGHQEENASNWHLRPVQDVSARMTALDWNDLMEGGVWTIGSVGNISKLVASLTTASKASGSSTVHDRRKWSTHVVSIADYVASWIEARAAATYRGFLLKDDTKDRSGRVTTKIQRRPPTLYPSTYRSFIISQIEDPFIAPMLDHIEDIIIPSIYTGIDANNTNRAEATLDLRCANILMQIVLEMNEVTPG